MLGRLKAAICGPKEANIETTPQKENRIPIQKLVGKGGSQIDNAAFAQACLEVAATDDVDGKTKKVLTDMAKLSALAAERDEALEQADKLAAESREEKVRAAQFAADAAKHKEKADEARKAAAAAKAIANELLISGTAEMADATEKLKVILTKVFLEMFGKKAPDDKLAGMHTKYLADGSMTVEKIDDKAAYILHSIECVRSFVSKNPNSTTCHFEKLIISDAVLTDLATYLTTSTLTAVYFSDSLSAENKALLADAKATRDASGKPLEINFI